MLGYAVKLSLEPWNMGEADVQELRDAGFSNPGILDIAHVTGYYAYVNRLAAVSYTHLTLPTICSV